MLENINQEEVMRRLDVLCRREKQLKVLTVIIWILICIIFGLGIYSSIRPQNYRNEISTYKEIAQEMVNGNIDLSAIPENTRITKKDNQIIMKNELSGYSITVEYDNEELAFEENTGSVGRMLCIILLPILLFLIGYGGIVEPIHKKIGKIFYANSKKLMVNL